MAFKHRPNSGSVFKNEEKQLPEHADYNGSGVIEGRAYFINMWINRPEGKKPFFSISFKAKTGQRQEEGEPEEGRPPRPPARPPRMAAPPPKPQPPKPTPPPNDDPTDNPFEWEGDKPK